MNWPERDHNDDGNPMPIILLVIIVECVIVIPAFVWWFA